MMMRNRFTVLKAAVIVLTLYAATMLSACSTPGREGPDVMVVIVEQHANSASGVPEDVIRYAVEAEVHKFSIIRLDGAPEVVVTANLTSKAKNKAARQVEIDRLVGELTTLAGAVVAEQPEVNLLAGLSLAARILGTDGRRELVVAASGLNTAGPLKLQEPGMLEAEPGDIIAALGDEVPSLDGVDLLFNGLGDTGGPDQERPSGTSRMHLVSSHSTRCLLHNRRRSTAASHGSSCRIWPRSSMMFSASATLVIKTSAATHACIPERSTRSEVLEQLATTSNSMSRCRRMKAKRCGWSRAINR
jgi:hypothetical protein